MLFIYHRLLKRLDSTLDIMFNQCSRSKSLMALSTISCRNILKPSSKLLTHCLTPINVMPNCNRFYCSKYINKLPTTFVADTYYDNYRAIYPELVTSLTDDYMKLNPELEPALSRFKKVLDYNVPSGKALRAMMLIKSVETFSWPNEISPENLHLTYVLGSLIEMLQGFYLILDDLNDDSEIRRNQMCWHKKVGLFAINDAHSIEAGTMMLLQKYFRQKPYYYDLIELFRRITFNSALGELMDIMVSPTEIKADIDKFNIETYRKITKCKAADYSFYLPFAAGMLLAGIEDKSIYACVDKISEKFGLFAQVSNDYLDIYGDPAVTGKIGTDIQNGRCTWFIIQALRLSSPEQVAILKQNYGKDDPACVAKVKAVYHDLQLETDYRKYEDEEVENITKLIEDFSFPYPTDIFTAIIAYGYRRKS